MTERVLGAFAYYESGKGSPVLSRAIGDPRPRPNVLSCKSVFHIILLYYNAKTISFHLKTNR